MGFLILRTRCFQDSWLKKSQPSSSQDPKSEVPRDISYSLPQGRYQLRPLHPRKEIKLDSKIGAPSCSLCPSPMPGPGTCSSLTHRPPET